MVKGGIRLGGAKKIYNKKLPIISIITVVYNGVNEIENTIQSIINQTYENLEYIIIDGKSIDGTLEVIKKYENKIDYWQSTSDTGIYDAMNKGIDLASGEWINFMNCGDKFYNDKTLNSVFQYLSSEINVLYGNTIANWNFGYELMFPNKDKVMPFCHQSCFTRTSLLKEIHFNTHYKLCADRKFYYDLNEKNINTKKYLNLVISVFDCINSLSVDNQVKLFKEKAQIYNYKFMKYYLLLLKVYLFNIFKKYFKNIICIYRKYRSRKKDV